MTLLTSTALAILGGIFAALLAFGGVRAAWRGFAGRRGTFAALCVLAAFCAILADKPTPVPSALLRWDRGLADNGSIATNDTVFIRGTYDPLMANDALHVDYRDRTITDSPDGWSRAYDGAVGDLADGFAVTIPDATNMVVWIWSEYVEPAPTHTNGEYRIIYVGRIDGGAADAPRYVTPRTPIVASSEIIPVEYLESSGTQYIDTGIALRSGDTISCCIEKLSTSRPGAIFGARIGAASRNISGGIALNNDLLCDYNDSDYSTYRAITSANAPAGVYEMIASPTIRSIVGPVSKTNSVQNAEVFEPPGTCLLFAGYGVFWNANKFNGRIISFFISRNGVKIIDFIPVRVGSVGYMFDRVSGEYLPFGNKGTGSFILGPDVRNGSAILSPPSLPPPAQSLFSTLATENLTE